ncbi:lethal (3) malignant brain tumor [Haematobia irritans]|uniref:lethal (3) malignant brain tumor n=1 Tax=Haematobia irritans TaxID=7368 RepID=UPI003F504288
MNPLNTQQQPQTQYFIATGMPSVASSSDQHLTTTSSTLPQTLMPTTATTNSSLNNNQTNHFMDANNYVTTSYVPVQFLSNQTLLTKIEPMQQQQPSAQNIPPAIINVTNSSVVATANIPLISSNPGSNVTYVVTSPQTQNFGPVLSGQNGTVSVLLTTPTSTAIAASGHVAAPFIIRNTSSTQVKQQLPQPQQIHNQSFNTTQLLNSETLKHVNTGTTLLKSSLLQNKSIVPNMASTSLNSSGMDIPQTSATQAVKKLPQVSLLQNSKSKQTPGIIGNGPPLPIPGINTNVGNTTTTPDIINEKSKVLKNPYEIRVGNLSAEVSLIKKANLITENAIANSIVNVETNSLLKPIIDVNRKKDKMKTGLIQQQTTLAEISVIDKQESLLKTKSNNTVNSPTVISPRNQRSKSCNSGLKSQNDSPIPPTNANERRHSEPPKLEKPTASTMSVESNKTETPISGLSKDSDTHRNRNEEQLENSGGKYDASCHKTLSDLKTILPEESTNESSTKDNLSTNTANENLVLGNEDKLQLHIADVSSVQDVEQVKSSGDQTEGKVEGIESDSDDDVTILPIDDSLVEPIEIDDDDEEENELQKKSKDTARLSTNDKEKLNDSLLCDEQILISSSSSISNQSADQSISNSLLKKSPQAGMANAPSLKNSLIDRKQPPLVKEEPSSKSNAAVLDMLSNFNMLNWRERLGTIKGTNMKFQLNEFNLVQLHEKVSARKKSYTAYEKPIYERDDLQIRSKSGEPQIQYMCRRCKVRAPALDFLAPEFCSIYCLKRDCRKRQREDQANIIRKKHRYLVNNNNPPPLTYIAQPKFRWSNYLKANYTSMAAPISLFLNPFPTGPNNFKIGMKLEAIDPENCALFCVCTVVDINGYRLKLSFDGYDSSYDFWLNADSMDIFPPGWCAKTNRILQPPKGISASKFNWGAYLNREKGTSAPRHLFTHLNSSSLSPRNPFQIGMHLEAEDLNDSGKLCVASVADVLDDRIRIHFDGWDDCYDIIVDINSPYIHPCGWHEGRHQLVVPPDCENLAFNWENYIRKQGKGIVASEELFIPREPIHFKPNMKLEVVDPRNSSLIRPATVVSHKGHRVKLHLDGWPNDYCFWLEDDSPDLHPIGWCDATGHDLEPPPGFQLETQKMPCPTPGCRGIGNAKKCFMTFHATRDCCPYVPENWRTVVEKPPRVSYDDIVRSLPRQHKLNNQQNQNQQILERLQLLDNIKTRNVVNSKDLLGISMAKVKKEESKETKYNAPATSSISDEQGLDVNIEIAKHFLCDYGPRLQQAYTLWQKNFTLDTGKIKRNPMLWSVSEVGVFVDLYLNCSQTAAQFAQEDIDGEAFLLLQQCDLTEKLNIKLGPAVKLYSCILQLRTLAVTKFNVAYRKAFTNTTKDNSKKNDKE